MKFSTALQKLNGQSVGGQLIAYVDGAHVYVGRHHDGELIDVTEEGQKLIAGLTDNPLDHDNDGKTGGGRRRKGGGQSAGVPTSEPAPEETTHHEVMISDEIIMQEETDS